MSGVGIARAKGVGAATASFMEWCGGRGAMVLELK